MIDDLLAAIRQPQVTAQDIIAAATRAAKYLDPRYRNLLLATRGDETKPEPDKGGK